MPTPIQTGTVTTGDIELRGACVYVTVRNRSDVRREFQRFCEQSGLARELLSEGEDTVDPNGNPVRGLQTWKVVGPPEALAKLAETNHLFRLWWVVDCQLGMNGVVLPASGAGEK